MVLSMTKKKTFHARYCIKKFLFFPIIYRGKFHWLKFVKLEKGYNGKTMQIINLENFRDT